MRDEKFDLDKHFEPLWSKDVKEEEAFPSYRPLIAHYCSQATLEAMARNNEFWFSNPLYANDYEELSFGLLHGRRVALESKSIRDAFSDSNSYEGFKAVLSTFFSFFDQGQLQRDIYIACFSIHNESDNDGLLSMWRGYGSNGSGVAIVFRTDALKADPEMPLILGKVQYGGRAHRMVLLDNIVNTFADLMKKVPHNTSSPGRGELINQCAAQLFERILMFSIFTKDEGFKEENEFRIVYLRHRDIQNRFSSMLDYAVIGGAIQPKFKFKFDSIQDADGEELTLYKAVQKIILGPSSDAENSAWAVSRMLNCLGNTALAERVRASTIPYRPKGAV